MLKNWKIINKNGTKSLECLNKRAWKGQFGENRN